VKYRIADSKHLAGNHYVRELAYDFELLDAWEFPMLFDEDAGDSLFLFRKICVEPTFKNLFNNSPSGLLFKARALLGRLFLLDGKVNQLPIPGTVGEELSDRMSVDARQSHVSALDIDIRTNNYMDFRRVYSFKNETLNEISNASEHTLMHYAWVKSGEGNHKVQMASYVKHRNRLSPLYLKLIEPFKRYIVYQSLFEEFEKRWSEHLAQKERSNLSLYKSFIHYTEN
jgi:hypothetical protein